MLFIYVAYSMPVIIGEEGKADLASLFSTSTDDALHKKYPFTCRVVAFIFFVEVMISKAFLIYLTEHWITCSNMYKIFTKM